MNLAFKFAPFGFFALCALYFSCGLLLFLQSLAITIMAIRCRFVDCSVASLSHNDKNCANVKNNSF